MKWLIAACCVAAQAGEPLPALQAQRAGVTASGVSSGADMAVQLHVALSATISGVGALAGGPYYCAQGSLFTALSNCMAPGAWTPVPRPEFLKREADALASAGRIDSTQHLAGAPVWLFSGTNDHTVDPLVVTALRNFYAQYKADVVLVSDQPAGHGMVTEEHGKACERTEPPFIVDCGYDAAGELLKHLLGKLAPRAISESGRLVRFDQAPYSGNEPNSIALGATGFLYVPKSCEGGGCRVHVAFHGCRQGAAEIGEQFVREAGYNRWADTNRLIVLYPQAIARYWWVYNPRGCWDWWGYTGAAYHTRDGAQIGAVRAMLDRLAQ